MEKDFNLFTNINVFAFRNNSEVASHTHAIVEHAGRFSSKRVLYFAPFSDGTFPFYIKHNIVFFFSKCSLARRQKQNALCVLLPARIIDSIKQITLGFALVRSLFACRVSCVVSSSFGMTTVHGYNVIVAKTEI